jgi:hypothetical protein
MKIERRRGDTYPDVITVKNRRTGSAVNTTGCTFKLTVDSRSAPTDNSTQLYQITGSVDAPASGEVKFAPTAEQANLVGTFYYDIEMIDSYNQIITLDSDLYIYHQDITK